MRLCANRLHDMTEANTLTMRRYDRTGGMTKRCRACYNARSHRSKESVTGPRHEHRASSDTADDFMFLFETGLSPRAIAAKLSMHYPSMLIAVRRAGVQLAYDFRAQTWTLS